MENSLIGEFRIAFLILQNLSHLLFKIYVFYELKAKNEKNMHLQKRL